MSAVKATESEFYEAVGRALSKWSILEEHLCSVFITALQESSEDIAGPIAAAYWAVISFDARLKMVHAAVETRCFHFPELVREWARVRDAMSHNAQRRAELAHGTLLNAWYYDRKAKDHKSELCFVPSFFKQTTSMSQMQRSASAADARPAKRLSLFDINERIERFRELSAMLERFHARLYERFPQATQ